MQGVGRGFLERLPLCADRPWIGYACAVLFSLIGLLVRFAVDPVMSAGFPYLTFFPAIVFSAFLFGTGPALLATVLCGVAANYFFMPPRGSFKVDETALVALAFYGVVTLVDVLLIHWMLAANRALAREREENRRLGELRRLMFDELQHRVSNKLQIIAALLSLQKRRVADPEAQRVLEEAARRVGLIGKISRALHDPTHDGLDVEAFLRQVGGEILDASGARQVRLSLDVAPDCRFSSRDAVPIALIFAECVSNAVEHGFGAGEGGSIAVRVERDGDGLCLSVTDDGRGLPAGFSVEAGESLGLRIAATLARQMGGRFALEAGPEGRGARAELRVRRAEG